MDTNTPRTVCKKWMRVSWQITGEFKIKLQNSALVRRNSVVLSLLDIMWTLLFLLFRNPASTVTDLGKIISSKLVDVDIIVSNICCLSKFTADTHTYTHTHAHTLIMTHIHTLIYTHNHSYKVMHIHIHSHTHPHTHTHTHTHIHSHMYTLRHTQFI